MNKYIFEKGIISLINIYAELRTEEIFELVSNIKYIMYYDAITDELVDGVDLFDCDAVFFICITNNNFMIFQQIYTFDEDGNDVPHIEINNIKFNKNKMSFYMHLLKESINLDSDIFTEKYKKILDSGTKKVIQYSLIKELHKLLINYDVKFYVIKINNKECWACIYDNEKLYLEEHSFNVRFEYNDEIAHLENMYNNMQYNIKYFTHSINIHNLS
jgi:hypothetical protein